MNTFTVIIDSQPDYLSSGNSAELLLLAPLGPATVLEHLLSCLHDDVKQHSPWIVAPSAVSDTYHARLDMACPDVRAVGGWSELTEALQASEPSDMVFIIDPRCLPTHRFDLPDLRGPLAPDPRWAIHLVSFDRGPSTKELVHFDSAGRVRRIQRYYESVTWPFITGVAGCLLPV